MTHFGVDQWEGYRRKWFGPLGIGVQRREIRLCFWFPSFAWVWGYWR